ncbi:FG-GAP-like repeat-containing protein [Jiangella alkaliphila]|uniref:Repeat domain-containing protein n=1 Tax=Jiangella alkaliphila TaxID=419479 RepID=A0A1H2LU14_9ACTN|nr:FG-GAP-like repeat-containing protein [Jiangella alkaliphila]SDU84364.1 Repeat domain-containing protein [Jiangella alkaliphila]
MHPRNVVSRRPRAVPAAFAVVTLAVAGLTALPASGSDPAPAEAAEAAETAETAVQTIALDDLLAEAGPTARSDGSVPGTGAIETDPFDVAAVTWPATEGPSDIHLHVRARADGTWTDWYELHDDGHAPDPGTPEADGARRGTDPVVVPGSEAIELRVEAPDGEVPAGLELTLIDPGTAAADAAPAPAEAQAEAGATASAAPLPPIHSRAAWGADESLREQTDPLYGDVEGGFVHHTAGTNTYTEADVPAILRGIYEYHVTGRGWRDIGYNFFVDRFGRIWEGRWGGIDRAVVGAHVEGYNSYSVGVAALGEFTATQPGQPVIDAYAQLFAWKFGLGDVDPLGTFAYPNQQTLPTISGHRDGVATECPGELLYAQLGTIRAATQAQLNPPPAAEHDFDGDGRSDMIGRGSSGALFLLPGRGNGTFGTRVQIGTATNWGIYTAFVPIGDFDGDQHGDLIARENSGKLFYLPGRSNGTLGTRVQIGTVNTWSTYSALVGVGDFNGDGHNDMIGRGSSGALFLLPGRSNGTFAQRVQIGTATNWGIYTALIGVGDFNGDGHNDMIGRESTGKLFYHPGRSNGTLGTRVQIGTVNTWSTYSALVGVGDFNGDGHNDMIGRGSSGALFLLPGRSNGTFAQRVQIGTATTWKTYTALV